MNSIYQISEGWKYLDFLWDQSKSKSNLSSIDPSPPSFKFNSNCEDTQPTLEDSFEAFMQLLKQVFNANAEISARLDMLESELANG